MPDAALPADPDPDLAAHLAVAKYGRFLLTDAVRPAVGVPVLPREGYRVEVFRDRASRLRLPMLSAAVSGERLFDVFLDLLKPLGKTVHAVFESSHAAGSAAAAGTTDYRRNHIDAPVLASHLCDFEDLLLNDGCTGVAVLSARRPVEVQFDEHKLLTVYAADLRPFRRVLRAYGIRRRESLPLIAEAEHLHHSTAAHADRFEQLCHRVGVADYENAMSDDESFFE